MKKFNKNICNVFLGSDIYIATIDLENKNGYYTIGRLKDVKINNNKVRLIILDNGIESVYAMSKKDFFNGGNSVVYESEFFNEKNNTKDYVFATNDDMSHFCNSLDVKIDSPERNNYNTFFIRGNRFLGDEIRKYFLSLGCNEYNNSFLLNKTLNYWDDNLLFYNIGHCGSIECCEDGSKVHELLKSACRELTVCDILKEMCIDKNADYNKKTVEVKSNFKLGDKVIVRNKKYNDIWMPSSFQQIGESENGNVFIMIDEQAYTECLELNNNTMHLIGTSEDPKNI